VRRLLMRMLLLRHLWMRMPLVAWSAQPRPRTLATVTLPLLRMTPPPALTRLRARARFPRHSCVG
jgi:hypothetical protein